jgi:hypothetical protein
MVMGGGGEGRGYTESPTFESTMGGGGHSYFLHQFEVVVLFLNSMEPLGPVSM